MLRREEGVAAEPGLLDFSAAPRNALLPQILTLRGGVRGPLTMSSEQPLKSVYRSANISLRKADLARQNGDDDEELYHLNQLSLIHI